MKITETKLKGCFILEPKIHVDDRGLFFESYHKAILEQAIGESINFVQDNISVSKKGVLRGLHFQTGKHAQSKLVQVLKGEVLDVVVDLREQSSTFGQHLILNLSSENKISIFIPKGMAHGFLALTEDVIFTYKCDSHYHKDAERGIKYNDPDLNIDWEKDDLNLIISPKDLELPLWKELQL
ncbi:dTDP-4-dehydrorhamnose 3,5-epimerase [Arenibacter sp. BSSL-BM3]|uniref:dTDP-4-dehydrorhamnose 3,5-epimerase n=1 Tax=Arenibacter arenosicollis TaxID=2762274 RepID=A0ABR7QIB1_9FLAO|nr:dTDP-4-dehydrorhamnose 3,5-epimerase [Arenibacter arenosicollis]MBC8766928.1 dTDP-4-dehydrorhamnose 3,5-epimerase [Arenibacter arenosicollis]